MRRAKRQTSLAGAVLGVTVLPVLLAFIALVPAARSSAAAGSFVVIVNAANPVAGLNAREVSNAFLKKMARWPNGDEVAPFDLREQSAVREVFSHEIHEKGAAAVKAYWQKMIFSGRAVPPPEKATSAEVVASVAANRGGIGYVSAETALGEGVKVLRITP